jgi:hypothetical protein
MAVRVGKIARDINANRRLSANDFAHAAHSTAEHWRNS